MVTLTGKYSPKNKHLPNIRKKLRAQQPLVWIRILRILRIYDNVSGLIRKIILNGTFISKPLADALRIGEKKGEK